MDFRALLDKMVQQIALDYDTDYDISQELWDLYVEARLALKRNKAE